MPTYQPSCHVAATVISPSVGRHAVPHNSYASNTDTSELSTPGVQSDSSVASGTARHRMPGGAKKKSDAKQLYAPRVKTWPLRQRFRGHPRAASITMTKKAKVLPTSALAPVPATTVIDPSGTLPFQGQHTEQPECKQPPVLKSDSVSSKQAPNVQPDDNLDATKAVGINDGICRAFDYQEHFAE